jgi:hypothetical protein
LEDSILFHLLSNWKLDGEYVKEESGFWPGVYSWLHRLMARIPDVGGVNFSRFLEEIPVQSEVTDLIIVTTYLNEGIFGFLPATKGEWEKTVRVLLLRATSWEIPEDCNVYLLRREVLPDAGNIA